jgi:CHAT domain-containing protein/tetratricopeptide (TPR) repeat protein
LQAVLKFRLSVRSTFGNRILPLCLCLLGSCTHRPVANAPNLPTNSVISKREISLTGGKSRSYSLKLAPDRFVEAKVLRFGISASLRLFDDSGKLLSEVDSRTGPYGPDQLFWVTAKSGTYRLEITYTDKSGPAGRFHLSVWQRQARDIDKQLVQSQALYMNAEALMAKDAQSHAQDAQAKYLTAAKFMADSGHESLEAHILNRSALAFAALDQWENALQQNQAALKLASQVPDPAETMEGLTGIGRDLVGLGRYDEAKSRLEEAVEIQRSSSDRYLQAQLDVALGTLAVYKAEYKGAIKYFDEAVQLYTGMHVMTDVGDLLANIGLCHQGLGNLPEAMQYYERSLKLSAEAGDNLSQAVLLDSIGRIQRQQGDYSGAIRSLEESARFANLAQDRRSEAIAAEDLAYSYRLLGEFDRALVEFKRVLSVAQELQDRRLEESTLIDISGCARDQGRFQEAIDAGSQALALARSLKDESGEGDASSMLGLAYARSGKYTEARDLYMGSIAAYKKLGLRGKEGTVRANLSEALAAEGHFDSAMREASEALLTARAATDVAGQVWALEALMNAAAGEGQTPLGIFFGKQAVNIVQGLRANVAQLGIESQRDFATANSHTFRRLAELLVASGRLAEAEQVLGLLKEQEYFEYVRRDAAEASSVNGLATLSPEEVEGAQRYREIADKLVAIGAERGNLIDLGRKRDLTSGETRRLDQLEKDIEAGNQRFEQFIADLPQRFSAKPVARSDLRETEGIGEDLRELPPGTVAIFTLVGEDKFRAILRTPDVEKAYEYPIKAANLNRKVSDFRQVATDARLDPRPLAEELYKIVIGPMGEDLREAKAQTLMWSLDGVLRYLPLAALYDGHQYLLEQYRISVMTLASIARLKDRPDAQWRAAGFGVTKGYEGAEALPEVSSELAGIISTKPGGPGVLQGEIKLDDQFTQQGMRQTLRKGYPVVHIASHFRFQPGNDTQSYLLLGDGGHLSLAELKNSANLFSGVQLLTLSACNTGLGDGTEVEGFGTLAQRQGAKAVIASLWPVADESTSQLMQDFYRIRQSAPGMTKLEALREAQLELLRGEGKAGSDIDRGKSHKPRDGGSGLQGPRFPYDPKAPFAHPFYWAPFFLMGNWL